MIQFHLTKSLAKELELSAQPSAQANPGAIQWYAHLVTIARRKCIIAMELHSRYAMVFCGLTKKDFKRFPDYFHDRLWREVCVIAQIDGEMSRHDEDLLSELALTVSSEQEYLVGSNRSVLSHINQVKEHLEVLVYDEGYALPIDDDDALRFGLIANDMLRKHKGLKDYFIPVTEFKDFWLGLLEHYNEGEEENLQLDQHDIKQASATPGSNVVAVDFQNKKRL